MERRARHHRWPPDYAPPLGGSVLDLQVDIVVSYGNPPDVMVTDKLMGCQFTDEENAINQGDKNEEILLPFIFLRKIKG